MAARGRCSAGFPTTSAANTRWRIAFGLGGVAYWLLGSLGHAPWAFVLFAALIFLTWGEIFSLFPSTCTDTFGTKFATVNLSLLYTAKGASAFLVPVANIIKISYRELAHGVRRHRDHELRGRGAGAVRAQADAESDAGKGLTIRVGDLQLRRKTAPHWDRVPPVPAPALPLKKTA